MLWGVLESACSQQGLAPRLGDFPFRHSPATCHKQGDAVSIQDRSRNAAVPMNQALSLLGCACLHLSLPRHSIDTVCLGQRTPSTFCLSPLPWPGQISPGSIPFHTPRGFPPREELSLLQEALKDVAHTPLVFWEVIGNAIMIIGDRLFSLYAPGQPCAKHSTEHISLAPTTAL